jgi:hypothetical protein
MTHETRISISYKYPSAPAYFGCSWCAVWVWHCMYQERDGRWIELSSQICMN